MRKRMSVIALITAVVGAFFMLASNALASSNIGTRVDCRLGDSHTWSHLGGDPVWPGGVHSVGQLSVVVNSAAGQRSLVCLGLNQAERSMVTKQIAQAKSCVMKQGQEFVAMTFHADGASVDRPTKFVDARFPNGASAFCLTVKVKEGGKTTVTIKLLWPEICVNAALISQTSSTPPKPVPVPPKPPVVPPGSCNVTIINSPGASGQACNTYYVIVMCNNAPVLINGGTVKEAIDKANQYVCSTVVNPPPVIPPVPPTPAPPQTFTATATASASASATATVNCPSGSTSSTATASASGSATASGSGSSTVSQADAQNKAQANAQANASAAASAECKQNRPPQVQIVNGPAHVFTNGQVQICANFSDPDGDQLQVSWSASRGTVSNGRDCVTYTAPGTEGNDTVTVTVSDGLHSVQASVTFPVVKDTF